MLYLCRVLAASPPAHDTAYFVWGRLRRPQTPTLGSNTYPCQTSPIEQLFIRKSLKQPARHGMICATHSGTRRCKVPNWRHIFIQLAGSAEGRLDTLKRALNQRRGDPPTRIV